MYGCHSLLLRSILLLSITILCAPLLLLHIESVYLPVRSLLRLADYSLMLELTSALRRQLLAHSSSLPSAAAEPLWSFLSAAVTHQYQQNQILSHFHLYSSPDTPACEWSDGDCCAVTGCSAGCACDAIG